MQRVRLCGEYMEIWLWVRVGVGFGTVLGQVRGTGPGLVLVEFLGSHNWGWVDRRKMVPFVLGGKVPSTTTSLLNPDLV